MWLRGREWCADTRKGQEEEEEQKKKKMLSLNAIDNPRESFWTKYTPGVALISTGSCISGL